MSDPGLCVSTVPKPTHELLVPRIQIRSGRIKSVMDSTSKVQKMCSALEIEDKMIWDEMNMRLWTQYLLGLVFDLLVKSARVCKVVL